MDIPVPVTRRQLLKNIHVSYLYVIMRIQMISESGKKTVLIKVIVHNFFTGINMYIITQNK